VSANRVYRFCGCRVDSNLRQVYCRGELAEPQPKALDLLLYLIEHRDRVVHKNELLDALWPGVVVSESALTQAVKKARAMVADDGDRQAVIRTVPRRGFRFVADLDVDGAGTVLSKSDAAAQPGRELDKSKTRKPSVAVLPFADMSPDRNQEYFCDGMAEEIINELTHIPGLEVAARTSAFSFKNLNTDVREIARQLGVSFVLEGSVRKAGERLRVAAQLLDAATGFHLWAESWNSKLEDMFAIQEEIARHIATALRKSEERAKSPAITAEELCRRGLVYRDRGGMRSQRFAIELFNQALALDPTLARAWAGLSISYSLLEHHSGEPGRYRKAAFEAADKAVALDSASAEAWTAKGTTLARVGDFVGAESAFERALELAPELFEANYYFGRSCTECGRFEKAAELYERAASLKPEDYQALLWATQAYISLGQNEAARDAAARQLSAADRALSADPTDARALSLSASSLIRLGRPDEARARVERACALEPDESYVHYNAACCYALLGEVDSALDVLEGMTLNAGDTWIMHDENLDALRDNPRYMALVRRSIAAGR